MGGKKDDPTAELTEQLAKEEKERTDKLIKDLKGGKK